MAATTFTIAENTAFGLQQAAKEWRFNNLPISRPFKLGGEQCKANI